MIWLATIILGLALGCVVLYAWWMAEAERQDEEQHWNRSGGDEL